MYGQCKINVDLRRKGQSGEETQTRLCGGNWSETSTPHRSGKRCGVRRSNTIQKQQYNWHIYSINTILYDCILYIIYML